MKRGILLILVTMLFMGACTGKEATVDEAGAEEERLENLTAAGEMPIVKDQITLNFFAGRAATTNKDWNDVLVFNEYEEISNIDIEWEMIPREGLEEKRNLTLVNDKLPDVFHTAGLPNNDLMKYGEQGAFLKLNDLIEEHMPNLNRILEENPDIKKGMTFPDGSIYSLPTIYDPDFPSLLVGSKFWIREDWLEELNMTMPQTTDDYYEYLKAVKETDLNGNGKNDEIPFGGTSITGLFQWLTGSFGIQNRGRNHGFIDLDPETENLRFFPIEDEYKELLEYMHKLYSEGLIQTNIYTIETNESYAQGTEGLYGSTVQASTVTAYGHEEGDKFIGMPTLEGPNGDKLFTKLGSPLANMGGFVVTSDNEHPEATVRWMDYFYGDEGAKLFFMGVEDITYKTNEDGTLEYLDEIDNNPDGLTFSEALSKYMTWSGGGYPGIVMEDYFNGAESMEPSITATEELIPYFPEEVWPQFTFTNKESKELASLASDIEKYVNEMRDKFITGNVSLDEWDSYIAEIKKMGLDAYMEIQENAYERYKNN